MHVVTALVGPPKDPLTGHSAKVWGVGGFTGVIADAEEVIPSATTGIIRTAPSAATAGRERRAELNLNVI
jgi:hypothetical protein